MIDKARHVREVLFHADVDGYRLATMSSIHLPRVVGQRGKTSLDVERENFEKRQVGNVLFYF